MSPVIDAKKTMLLLLRDLTGSSCVRMRSDGTGAFTSVDSNPIADELLIELKTPTETFCNARSIIFEKYQFDFNLVRSNYAQILIHLADQEMLDSMDSKRKNSVSMQHQNVEVSFDLVSENGFIDWFNAFVGGQKYDGHELNSLFLTLSAIVQGSAIYTDYQKYTQDSLTKLQSRTALQSVIDNNIKNGDIVLCMIHCRDFQGVNRKFGQAKGDTVLNEIAEIIVSQTREDDITCRFGGALFGVATYANDIESAKTIANSLHQALQSRPYLSNAVRLGFNIGVAMLGQKGLTANDSSPSSVIIARAEQALRAAQATETPSVVIWEQGKFLHDEQEFDHLGGIFTPDNVTNYRNMLLLWDITSIIADEHSFNKLLINVIERLAYTFEFSLAGIISSVPNNEHDITVSTTNIEDIKQVSIESQPFYSKLLDAKTKTLSINKTEEHLIDDMRCLIVPLNGEVEECFFIIGEKDKFDLTHDSIMLFAGFARQIGKALRRSILEEQLNRKLEQENATLVKELNELKSGLKSSALIYKSEAMQTLLKHAQRAAQTDTTVLITGESGTGKEKLIHALHGLSDRNQQPPVIVDCGSIPETLIESELFGHVKGAFTGANSDKKGKILAADGGILVLDEIGELPLSMQPKLLRFVQEKHFTPVGSNKHLSVDVKIIAVTNRDLLKESEQGKFRKDLYYRLNVVTLHNPPLRERNGDVELLAKHFINKFCQQYDIKHRYLSADTIEKMNKYQWPGNIRQLENRLMQACLLSQDEEISYNELNLDPTDEFEKTIINAEHSLPSASPNIPRQQELVDNAVNAVKTNAEVNITPEQWTLRLETAITQFVIEIEESLTHNNISIGETIESYLFKQLDFESRTNKQIAEKLNIPISTARRKVNKHSSARIPTTLPQSWKEITSLLDMITYSQVTLKEPLALIKQTTVQAVLGQIKSNMTRAAGLIGVSEPTLYKFKKSIGV